METKDYLTTIKRLQVAKYKTNKIRRKTKKTTFHRNQEENRKLSSSLTAATERDSGVSEDESYIEIDLVHKLQVVGSFNFSDFIHIPSAGHCGKAKGADQGPGL